HLLRSRSCFLDDRVCFLLCISQNCVFIADDLLITFDLIRSFQSKLTEQFFQLLFIYNNFCCGQRLIFTTVYVLLDLFNNLFNSTAHFCFSLSFLSTAESAPVSRPPYVLHLQNRGPQPVSRESLLPQSPEQNYEYRRRMRQPPSPSSN